MYRLLNSALNISSSGLVGLHIRKLEEAGFMKTIISLESDLRDGI